MSNEIISHKFKELLLPSILIAMALNISSIVDSSFVATFIGSNGLAALQTLSPLILLITIFEWLFGLGGQILSLSKKAEFDEDGSNHYFTIAMLSTIVLAILIFLACLSIWILFIHLFSNSDSIGCANSIHSCGWPAKICFSINCYCKRHQYNFGLFVSGSFSYGNRRCITCNAYRICSCIHFGF